MNCFQMKLLLPLLSARAWHAAAVSNYNVADLEGTLGFTYVCRGQKIVELVHSN
jgi:hypothetical protein